MLKMLIKDIKKKFQKLESTYNIIWFIIVRNYYLLYLSWDYILFIILILYE